MANTVDFTNILDEKDNVYVFNPSIARWKDDKYICLYRKFVRYPELDQVGAGYDYSNNPLADPNHPWLGGPASSNWWAYQYGIDCTGICLLRIQGTNVQMIKSYNQGVDIFRKTLFGANIIPQGESLIPGVDARLLYIGDNKFICSYNTGLQGKPEIKIKAGDCSGFCMLIATCILEISEADQILLHPEVILCPQISNPIEKNWSFWKRDGNLKFSYGLDPRHEVFDLALDPNDTLRCTGIHQVVQSAFIGQFKQYYRNKIHISVTTPAVPYHGDELYIGVGHVKYNYKDIDDLKGTVLYDYTDKMGQQGKKFHPGYVYLMFFYVFDKESVVRAISYMFSPPSNSALVFPSGITITQNNDYLISYGDADVRCKYFIATKEEIHAMLYLIGPHDPPLNPADVKFGMVA